MSGAAGKSRSYRKGVGAVIFNRDGRVLVARRIGTVSAWQLPQGGLRPQEDAHVAVKRELSEEIGTDRVEMIAEAPEWLRYEFPEHLKVWNGKYCGQEQRWFAFLFMGDEGDIDLAAGHRPEFDAWQWVDIEQLPGLAVDFKRSLYERLVEYFREAGPRAGTTGR